MLLHHPAVRTPQVRASATLNTIPARLASILLIALALTGCTSARTAPMTAADPADASVPIRSAPYSPVLSGYTSQRPVSPKPWVEQNQRVMPKERTP